MKYLAQYTLDLVSSALILIELPGKNIFLDRCQNPGQDRQEQRKQNFLRVLDTAFL